MIYSFFWNISLLNIIKRFLVNLVNTDIYTQRCTFLYFFRQNTFCLHLQSFLIIVALHAFCPFRGHFAVACSKAKKRSSVMSSAFVPSIWLTKLWHHFWSSLNSLDLYKKSFRPRCALLLLSKQALKKCHTTERGTVSSDLGQYFVNDLEKATSGEDAITMNTLHYDSVDEGTIAYNNNDGGVEDNFVNYSWMKERPRRSSSKSKLHPLFYVWLLKYLAIVNLIKRIVGRSFEVTHNLINSLEILMRLTLRSYFMFRYKIGMNSF